MSERRTQLEAQLSAYLDDELTPEQRAEVEAFLAEDADARALLAELRAVSSALHALPRARAHADLMEGVRARMERRALLGESEHQPRKAVAGMSATGRWTAAAAIVLMTGVAGYVTWTLNAGDKPPATLKERMALVDQPPTPSASPQGERPTNQFETTDVKSNMAINQVVIGAEPHALASATRQTSDERSASTVVLIACADDTGRTALLDAIAAHQGSVEARHAHERPASPAPPSGTPEAVDYTAKSGPDTADTFGFKQEHEDDSMKPAARPSAQLSARAPAASTREPTKAIEAVKEHEEKPVPAVPSEVADLQQPTDAKVTDVEVVVASEHARDELIRQLSREWSFESQRAEGLSREVDEVVSTKSKGALTNFSPGYRLSAPTTSQPILYFNEHQVGLAGNKTESLAKVLRGKASQTRPVDGYETHKPTDDHGTANVAGSLSDAAAAKPQASAGGGLRPNVAVNAESSSTRPASDGIAVKSDGDKAWVSSFTNDGESTATAPAAPALTTVQAGSAATAVPAQPIAESAPPVTEPANAVAAPAQPATACFVRLHIRVAAPTTTQPTAAPPASTPAETTQPHP